jgi:hypothetical protein
MERWSARKMRTYVWPKATDIWVDGAIPLQTKKESPSKPLSLIFRIKNKTKNRKNRDFSGPKIVFNFSKCSDANRKNCKICLKGLDPKIVYSLILLT